MHKKRNDQQDNVSGNAKKKTNRKISQRNVDTVAPYTSHRDAKCTAQIEQDVAELNTLSKYAGGKAEGIQGTLAERSIEQLITYARRL